MRAHKGIKAGLADFGDQCRAVCRQVAGEMVIAGRTLLMAIVLVEAQFWVSAGSAEVSCVVLPVMVAVATDAWLMPIPVPDELVERLLCLVAEVSKQRKPRWAPLCLLN